MPFKLGYRYAECFCGLTCGVSMLLDYSWRYSSLQELLHAFLYDNNSVFDFMRGLKLALHSHCYSNPLRYSVCHVIFEQLIPYLEAG